jgi:hypothetical protein
MEFAFDTMELGRLLSCESDEMKGSFNCFSKEVDCEGAFCIWRADDLILPHNLIEAKTSIVIIFT